MTTGKVAAIAKSMLGSGVGSAVADYIDEHPDIFTDYAKVDGSYSSLTAGNAEQLVATVGVNDKTPYLFRTTGGSADVGDRVKLSEITGCTVAWNQLVQNGNFADASNWSWRQTGGGSVSNNEASLIALSANNNQQFFQNISFVANHKYLVSFDIITSGSSNTLRYGLYSSATEKTAKSTDISSSKVKINNIFAPTVNCDNLRFGFYLPSVNDTAYFSSVNCYDLTAMFGSAIADYAYTREQSEAGSGIAWLKSYGFFSKPYYPYAAASLQSSKTSAHKTVGFNAYDNTAGKAKVVGGKVYQITGAYTALSLDGTSITPDASGYFTPSVNGELTVTGGNATDTCIHLKWDGERDGEYEPYVEYNYPLDSDLELRGIPKLDASNNLYYDGDGYAPDGTVTRKYAVRAYEEGDATDGSTMITDGTNTVYKLTTPTTESADPYQETQICGDFGTEEFVDSRTVPMPVGANALYQANLRAKLEMAPDSPDGDGDYIVRQTDGLNEYVLLEKELPSTPAEDGTYSLKCTVADGTATLSWVADT